MKIRLYPLLFLLLAASGVRGQYIVTRQMLQADSLSLYGVAGYFLDTAGRLGLEDMDPGRFTPLGLPSRRFETRDLHWVYFRIDNRDGADTLDLRLHVAKPFRTTIYEVQETSEVVKKRSGQVNRPWRGFLGYYNVSVLQIPPGQEVEYYLQLDNRPLSFRDKSNQYELALVSPEHVAVLAQRQMILEMDYKIFTASFLAVLLFLIVFTGSMYAQNREPVYLHYMLYIAIIFIYYLLRRSAILHTPFSYLNAWRMHAEVPLSLVVFMGYLNFIRVFLDVGTQSHPRLARALKAGFVVVLAALGLYVLASFFVPLYQLLTAFNWIRAALFVAGGWIMYRVYQEGGRLSSFIIGGTMALVVGGLMVVVSDSIRKETGIKVYFQPLSYTQMGVLAEAFIFALGLGYRTRMIKEEKTLAEIRALKAQLNPHFIFNSLNSIKDLIQKNKPDEAVSYLTKFSRLMRGILHHSDDMRVPAAEELELCRSYLTLEALRFDHRFSFEVHAEPELLDLPIPSLIFQPFLENAIWHGLLPKQEGARWVKLELFERGERVIGRVEDNGVGRNHSGQAGGGAGIRLIRERLWRLSPDAEVIISDKFDIFGNPEGTVVDIVIPKP
jgi:hypothetical protein